MTLTEASKASEIEVAELWTDGYMIVVGSDDDGYEISFKVGDMPPHARDHANTVEEAEQIVADSALYTMGSQDWEAREGE